MLIDSHCHLNYLDDPDAALDRARRAGVGGVLCIGVNQANITRVLDLARRNADVWATVGQHPDACDRDPAWVVDYLDAPSVVGVGETGLDYYRTKPSSEDARRQRESFEFHLECARIRDLPVVIHSRSASEDTIAAVRNFEGVRGVLHCFAEDWTLAEAALDCGLYVSVAGIVTFKNGDNVREAARRVPEGRLLIETDAPWLAPVPVRGRTNEPAYVAHTAARVATLRGIPIGDLSGLTERNFADLFGV
ncbi:MAG: TatD family hydrolase [Pseudomonadales bacterium]|nr:TatD family hydrolase [Pseudomonadales bacterium]MDP6472930.1 TatD family hydrolase [Pseudomonadales bacterium]MDP6826313.1 TatD family hydrolase [Pseudomonadales bacterium]MDP6972770.1 TatD family hydrolase [Pseudomonadales bacterium]